MTTRIHRNQELFPKFGRIEAPYPSASGNQALFYDENKNPVACGQPAYGNFGDFRYIYGSRSSPVSITTNLPFTKIINYGETCAGLYSDGSVFCWGNNVSGELGDNTITSKSSPTSVVGGHLFTTISGGNSLTVANSGHCIGLKSGGSVWAWGLNEGGELGDNSTTLRSSPVSVVGAHSFYKISSGLDFNAALKSNTGNCWCWGYNAYGAIGDNSITQRNSPVSVIGGHSFTSVCCGDYHAIASKSNGDAWCWGQNTYGELGDNSTTLRSSPVSVVGGHSFTKVIAGGSFNGGLKSDGSVWTWGRNNYGQLGDNTVDNKSSPISILGTHSFTDISFILYTAYGLKSDGSVWAWGKNDYGEIGDNSITHRSSPVSMVGGYSFSNLFIGAQSLSNDHATFLINNTGFSVGRGDLNQLGQVEINKSSPVSIPVQNLGNFTWVQCISNNFKFMALDSNGNVWNWGYNTTGQLGDNTIVSKSSPVSVVGAHSFVKVVTTTNLGNSFGLKSDGSIWGWGSNASYGLVGDSTGTNRSSPVSVVGGHSFIDIYGFGYHVYGLKSDGTAWGWGYNPPALGDNSTINRSSPVSVLGNFFFIKLGGGSYNTFGLDRNGALWSWGYNYNGSLGDGVDILTKQSPISVVGGHQFYDIVYCGIDHWFGALKPDGSSWCWGKNLYGVCGDNTTNDRSSPVSVVGNHSFIKLVSLYADCFGLKADGTVWGWGDNQYGQLGTNSITNRSSPVLTMFNCFVRYK